jgi:hypothetical protein
MHIKFHRIVAEDISKFLDQIGLGKKDLGSWSLDEGILAIADCLKFYQEEGVELRPEFYIFRESDHHKLGKDLAINHLFEVVQSATKSNETFRAAVKQCAPLAQGVWAGFIKIRDGDLAYGVMRRRYSAIDKAILSEGKAASQETTPFVRIRQVGKHFVEILGPRDKRIEIDFSISPPGPEIAGKSPSKARNQLLECLIGKGWKTKHEPVGAVLQEIFDRALSLGHGFLVGVVESDGDGHGRPKTDYSIKIGNGTYFNDWPIPIQTKVAELMKWQLRGNKAETDEVLGIDPYSREVIERITGNVIARYAEVEAWVELVARMIMSDGITLFDNRARVLGFRIFVKGTNIDDGSGGARLRAFETMKSLVSGRVLVGAFYQSQDGRALFFSEQPSP